MSTLQTCKFREYRHNEALWRQKGCDRLFSFFNTIKNEYPDFSFETEVIHHSELISDLVNKESKTADQTKAAKEVAKLRITTSCYLGRRNDVYDALRLLAKVLALILEMGHTEKMVSAVVQVVRMWMEEAVGERINDVGLKKRLRPEPILSQLLIIL